MLFDASNDAGTIDDDIDPIEVGDYCLDGLVIADVEFSCRYVEPCGCLELIGTEAHGRYAGAELCQRLADP
jgi:hypothetical protein